MSICDINSHVLLSQELKTSCPTSGNQRIFCRLRREHHRTQHMFLLSDLVELDRPHLGTFQRWGKQLAKFSPRPNSWSQKNWTIMHPKRHYYLRKAFALFHVSSLSFTSSISRHSRWRYILAHESTEKIDGPGDQHIRENRSAKNSIIIFAT